MRAEWHNENGELCKVQARKVMPRLAEQLGIELPEIAFADKVNVGVASVYGIGVAWGQLRRVRWIGTVLFSSVAFNEALPSHLWWSPSAEQAVALLVGKRASWTFGRVFISWCDLARGGSWWVYWLKCACPGTATWSGAKQHPNYDLALSRIVEFSPTKKPHCQEQRSYG